MIKNIALFLASSSLACIIPASTLTAPKLGSYEALSAERAVADSESYDGYNFFGDCIVEATVDYNLGVNELDDTCRVSFDNWSPQWSYLDFNTDRYAVFEGSDWSTYFDIFTTYSDSVDLEGFTLYRYLREFSCSGAYDDGIDIYDVNAYKWRVFQPTPIILPYVFLEQFLLGLSLQVQGDIDSFNGDLYIYNFNDHYFDRRYLSLRSENNEFPALDNSISPSSLRSIVLTNDNRYIYYQDKTASNYDPLYYDRGWVFCRFDLTWTTDATESTSLLYSNEYATVEVFELMDNAAPSQLEYDILRIWNMVFGDTVYLEPINPPDIIFGTVEEFLATEFIPDFSFGDLLLIVLGVMVFGAFLKVFLGG